MSNKSSSTTITATEVREMLCTAAQRLSSREEKAMRMRSGVGLGNGEALPRRGQESPEARAELMALELELVRKVAARRGMATGEAPKAGASVRTKEKDKIIRALRRLK